MKLFYRQIVKTGLFLVLITACTFVYGQIPVKGKVISAEDSQGMPGVYILIKGTDQGIVSGSDGTYNITVRSAEDILVFRFIGYITQEIAVMNKTTIDVILVPEITSLESVVVMGYSSKKRNEITSAVTTLSSDKLMDVTANDIGTMLQGKVSGIQVINSSGAPGASSEIRIRGISSFSAPQGPLYVVDGIIGGTFDPNDVETLTVLKDAGATGMYGSQANGGVIVVTTKKATSIEPRFEFKVVNGFRKADHGNVEMMDSKTLYAYHREYFRDPQKFVVDDRKFKAARPLSLLDVNTDWLSETFKPAMIQNYFLSSSGKSDKLSYYLGASYYDEEGTFINSNYQRANLRANTTYKFSDKVSLTNNINISGSKNVGTDYMNIYYAYSSMPWDNPYDENGKARSFKTAEGIWSKDKINPIQAAENSELSNKSFSFDYDIDLSIKILKWLTFSTSNRLSAYAFMDKTYYSKTADNLSYFGTGYVSSQSSFNYSSITTDLLKFNFEGASHSLSGLIGFEAQGGNDDYIFGSGMGIPEGLKVPSVASGQYLISGSPTRSVMQSFISQVNYNYVGKYFLSASYRIDQSSQFAPNKRTAKFPSVSAAWLISNEDFVKSISAVSNLKIKASWGKTGMKDIGPYRFMEMFSYSSQYDGQPAAVPTQMANPDLTWEQTDQLNAGLELGLFKRIDIEVDFYRNMTKDLLVERALPPSGGFRTQWQNIGKDMNSGVELSLTAAIIKTSDFDWSVDFSVGYNKNKLSGFGNDTILTSNYYGVTQVYHNGSSLYSWYAKEYYGIDPADGSMLWVGKDGETTHEYQDARYIEYGTPMPKYQGGFATMVRYKALSLRSNFSYVSGNKIFNYFRRYVDHDLQETQFNVMMPRDDYKLWQKPGDIATKPLPQNARNSFDPSTRFIDDGSFLKVRNITLSYELPKQVISKIRLGGMTVSLALDNVYTFTDFWGQDPEVSIDPGYGNLPGYAEFKYPNNRQYILSLNIRF
ncbi:MAG: SusC/RagA family TonB-linked outer membrane protein [Bacteroidia bacterium]|nr:SusC/RagA family TonB-linked outer membrane protein [Bacteroidia bacterium]